MLSEVARKAEPSSSDPISIAARQEFVDRIRRYEISDCIVKYVESYDPYVAKTLARCTAFPSPPDRVWERHKQVRLPLPEYPSF